MNDTVWLSYTTINQLYECSHSWINKMLGKKPEHKVWFDEGKDAHRLIQDHLSEFKKCQLIGSELDHLYFPIVERKDFDDNTRFRLIIEGNYGIQGFADGLNPETGTMLEIKTSSTLWSIRKYYESLQRKVYALGFPEYKSGVLVTCSRNPAEWKLGKMRTASVPFTDEDRQQALAWIKGGIAIIKAGKFDGGLDERKRCIDRNCYYGNNCHFRKWI